MREKPKVPVVNDYRRIVRPLCDILRIEGYELTPAYTLKLPAAAGGR